MLLWGCWERFWFESSAPVQMRVFRSALGGLLFCFYFIRTFDLDFYFSSTGMLPVQVMMESMPMAFRPSLLNYFPSTPALWFFHVLFLLSLLALTFGYFNRIATVVAFILHVSFVHRNMAIVFGVDLISVFFLLYLCFAQFEIKPAGVKKGLGDYLGSMAFRFSQIQVCIIYGFSGMEKIKGPLWWKGEAIWTVMANSELARWNFSWLSHFPLLIVAATYATLLWEIYFPVLIWIKPFRIPMLLLGLMLHFGIGLAVSIPFFAVLMGLTYILFLENSEALSIELRAKSLMGRKERLPVLSSPLL